MAVGIVMKEVDARRCPAVDNNRQFNNDQSIAITDLVNNQLATCVSRFGCDGMRDQFVPVIRVRLESSSERRCTTLAPKTEVESVAENQEASLVPKAVIWNSNEMLYPVQASEDSNGLVTDAEAALKERQRTDIDCRRSSVDADVSRHQNTILEAAATSSGTNSVLRESDHDSNVDILRPREDPVRSSSKQEFSSRLDVFSEAGQAAVNGLTSWLST
jgi:hypothetical protein